MKRAALAALALALAHCSGERTEIVLFIDQAGLQIPRDIDTLHIRLARDALAQPFFDVPIVICGGDTTTCKSLPLTATLIPGDKMPEDNVRLQLDASLAGATRISDVANFQFTRGQSLRLELVLTANCLGNLDCAKVDLACGELGCYTPKPVAPNADLSVPRDLEPPPDFSGVDFAGVDFTCAPNCDPAGTYCGADKNGCGVACTCSGFTACATNTCLACGLDNQACCPVGQTRCQSQNGPHACSSPTGAGTCVACLALSSSCSTGNGATPCCQGTVCNGTMCVACGMSSGDPCCPGMTCSGPSLTCDGTNHCVPCGGNNQPCCGTTCNAKLTCVGSGGASHCTPCGAQTQPCCSGSCNLPSLACDTTGNCAPCGANTQICCSGNTCTGSFLDCTSGHCAPCGQAVNDPCCSNATCANGLVCQGAFMMSLHPNVTPGGTCQNPPADMTMPMDLADAGSDMACTPACGTHNCGPDPGCPSMMCGFCSNPSQCDTAIGMCCGAPGQPCCPTNTCFFGTCNLGTGMCQPMCVFMTGCGNFGQPCCATSCCMSPLVCSAGTCWPPG